MGRTESKGSAQEDELRGARARLRLPSLNSSYLVIYSKLASEVCRLLRADRSEFSSQRLILTAEYAMISPKHRFGQ